MTINELKLKIENKVDISEPVIFKITDDDFIPMQYIHEISKYENKSIQFIDDLTEFLKNRLFFNNLNYIYVFKCDIFELDTSFDNLVDIFIICKSIKTKKYNKFITEVPKLENWQIKDYIMSLCSGIDAVNADMLIKCQPDMYAINNEISKIKLFSKDEQLYILSKLIENKNVNNYNIFSFSNAIMGKNIQQISDVYSQISINPIQLLSILYNNFKLLLSIQLSKNISYQDLKISYPQFIAISHFCGIYTKNDLIRILKFLTGVDKQIKTGQLQTSEIIDYILIHII